MSTGDWRAPQANVRLAEMRGPKRAGEHKAIIDSRMRNVKEGLRNRDTQRHTLENLVVDVAMIGIVALSILASQ